MAIANRKGFAAPMGQITFSEAEYQNKKLKTRREIFLERMDKLILETDGEEGDSLLPQGPERPATVPIVFHAAGSLHATLLQPQ
jgi:hypothetical protein